MKEAKIVFPHKKTSKKVTEMSEIVADVNSMHALLVGGKVFGYAVHHSQVSDQPFNFFCLHPNVRHFFAGAHTIINPKLVHGEDKRSHQEKCLSYPYRDAKAVSRYYKITIECLVENDRGRLESRVLDLVGLGAYIAQHEMDHAHAIYIYNKK